MQLAVERMCRVTLSTYMWSNKNEANEANNAKLDQSEYKEEEEEGGYVDEGEGGQACCPLQRHLV